MKFRKGQSGNPAGKRPGTKDKRTALRELLRPHAPALVEKAVEQALQGDTAALRLCLDRLMPPLRPVSAPIAFQAGKSDAETASSIVQAIASGDLSPDTGERLLSAMGHLAKIKEVDEIERRLAALEAKEGEAV